MAEESDNTIQPVTYILLPEAANAVCSTVVIMLL